MAREIHLIPRDMALPDRPPLCDECGEAATTVARDFREAEPVEGEGGLWAMWETASDWRFGCDKHPVTGRLFKRDGEVEYV